MAEKVSTKKPVIAKFSLIFFMASGTLPESNSSWIFSCSARKLLFRIARTALVAAALSALRSARFVLADTIKAVVRSALYRSSEIFFSDISPLFATGAAFNSA